MALLARIEGGDADAWDVLLPTLRSRILRLLERRGCEHALAEDLTQEALAAVWRSWKNVRDPGRFMSWVNTVALNQLRSTRIRSRVPEALPSEVAMRRQDPAQALVRAELRNWLLGKIDRVPRPEVRDALRLRMVEAMAPEVAAQELGVSRGRLRRWLHVGVVRLRESSQSEAAHWARALVVAG